MTFTAQYLAEASRVLQQLDQDTIEQTASLLAEVHDRGGRLFFLGVGGGAGHASHAVNDFRKIVGIEAYAPSDNVSELTARINDDGWDTAYASWLAGSRLNANDAVFVLSVGGGNLQYNVSTNLVRAVQYARGMGAKIFPALLAAMAATRPIVGGCLRADPCGQPHARDPPYRGVPGAGLAPAGIPSQAEGGRDKVGSSQTVADSKWQVMALTLLQFHGVARVFRALEAAGIPVIVLKGATLAETVYPDLADGQWVTWTCWCGRLTGSRRARCWRLPVITMFQSHQQPFSPFATTFTGEMAFHGLDRTDA